LIGGHGTDADLLAREIVALEAKPRSEDPEEAAEDETAVEAKREKLAKVKKDIGVLETFYREINGQWSDIARRNIGDVDWALRRRRGSPLHQDIGTFEVEAARFRAQFKGNVVDLGAFASSFS
jgi:hypothetical protein